jgi:hypothetical protein
MIQRSGMTTVANRFILDANLADVGVHHLIAAMPVVRMFH